MSDELHVTAEESAEIVDVKSQITVGLSLRRSAEMGAAAYDVAEFINVLREQTGEDYALDVRVEIGTETEAGRNSDGTPVVGFLAQQQPQADEEEDDYDRTHQ